MKTFTAEQKQHWVDVMQAHQDADRITQGLWWNGSKGCFFGCVMEEDNVNLAEAAKVMGLPLWLVRLAEKIHEGLPATDAINWPVKLLKAIPVETDISKIIHLLAIKRLTHLADKNPSVASEILTVAECHQLKLEGGDPDWSAAKSAAKSAAWSAAESAAKSAAWPARSAAWAAKAAARSAARSAESAKVAAWVAAEPAESAESAWSTEADNLIQELEKL